MSTELQRLLGSRPWMDEALCAQVDTELFYPEKGGSTRQAKQTCTSCPVREQCLAYALENDERHGIWGGLSERERHKLLRESGQKRTRPAVSPLVPERLLRGMHGHGLNDVEIARELNCSTETVRIARNRLGLAPNFTTYTGVGA